MEFTLVHYIAAFGIGWIIGDIILAAIRATRP
jgi:hypothetical protein